MERYIGLDAHQGSCTLAVVSERGKRLKSAVVETNGKALVEFIKTVAGRTHLCLEEGTQSSWLYEVLSPHVDEAVVTHLSEHGRGPKDDLRDALSLADRLRLGSVTAVFKDGGKLGQLRAQADVYTKLVSDVVRVKTRLKALYRSRGVSTSGLWVYSEAHRSEYLTRLPRAYRGAGRCLYEQLDALLEIKADAERELVEMSSKHAISSVLRSCPGWDRFGWLRSSRSSSRLSASGRRGSCGPTAMSTRKTRLSSHCQGWRPGFRVGASSCGGDAGR